MTKIGLALGSGGSRGLAHIGVLKCLLENNIKIDYLAGTSVGSLVGGLYAAWGDIGRLEQLFQNVDYKTVIQILLDPFTTEGIIKGEKFVKFLEDNLGNQKIEDLKIPFVAVATDLTTGQPHLFNSGRLVDAIRASCSLPLVFSPFKIQNQNFIDGGTSIPVPVSVLKSMGADKTIAVNVYTNLFTDNKANFASSLYALLFNLAQANSFLADVIVEPQLPNINPLDFINTKNLVDIGYQSTLPKISQIKKLNSFWSRFH